MTQQLFIFGLGYVGLSFALAQKACGWKVAGTCRSYKRKQELLALGIEAFVFDGESGEQEIGDKVASSNAILSTVPPVATGDPVLRVFGIHICRIVADSRRKIVGWTYAENLAFRFMSLGSQVYMAQDGMCWRR